jgi:hypothetical protein
MAQEEVTAGLLRVRNEPDANKRLALLERLAPIKDARVTVALVEAMQRDGGPNKMRLGYLVVEHHIPPDVELAPAKFPAFVELWWERNEAEVRRRAKQRP